MKKSYKDMKVYFASPWFNPEQAEREERVKGKLRELGFNVWSPKDNSSLSPITDPVIREKIFSANVENIKSCDILFAITDGSLILFVIRLSLCTIVSHLAQMVSSI